MFDVDTTLGPVPTAGRTVWRWVVAFSASGGGASYKLGHNVEGLAADLDTAVAEMQAAAASGVARLKALRFEVRDDAA